jgi:hypothetical protein
MEVEIKRLVAKSLVRCLESFGVARQSWLQKSGGATSAKVNERPSSWAAIEVVLTTVALADLARRPRAQVRGPQTSMGTGLHRSATT